VKILVGPEYSTLRAPAAGGTLTWASKAPR
jgi:hypothetical protein